MRRVRTPVVHFAVYSAVLLLIASCGAPTAPTDEDRVPRAGKAAQGGSMAEGDASYIASAGSPRELLPLSEAVVFATPTETEEVVLTPETAESGIVIVAKAFEITEVLKGAGLREGEEIFVTRTDLLDGVREDQPPYAASLYLLALQEADSYTIPSWYVVGGPSGRVPFKPDTSGQLRAFVEEPGDPVQEQLNGKTPREVKDALRP